MQGTREVERFGIRRGKLQFKFKEKFNSHKKDKKPQREKPQHKRWL